MNESISRYYMHSSCDDVERCNKGITTTGIICHVKTFNSEIFRFVSLLLKPFSVLNKLFVVLYNHKFQYGCILFLQKIDKEGNILITEVLPLMIFNTVTVFKHFTKIVNDDWEICK